MKRFLLPLYLLLSLFGHAQSTISTTDRYCYSANAGWIDARPSEANGLVLTETFLSGKAYAANFGWIDFGDGSPDNGHTYSNASATDYGVNVSPSGALSGYAYAGNIGWILFEPTHGQPTINFLTGQLGGHAYSANIGWIALDTASSNLVSTTMTCPDTDGDGIGDAYERQYFGSLAVVNATSDVDKDGTSDVREYQANTNPNDAQDFLKIIEHIYNPAAPNMQLRFTSKPNRLYRIEHNTDLSPSWTNSSLGTFAPQAGASTLSGAIPFTAGPQRFFRVVARRPLQP